MSARNFNIGVALTAHAEAELFRKSWASLLKAVARARRHGLKVQISVCLDSPDQGTQEIVSELTKQSPDTQLCRVDFRDASRSRNRSIAACNADYIAVLDGDDLICESWLIEAYTLASKPNGQRTIFHPELSLFFGPNEHLIRHISLRADEKYRAGLFLDYNPWTALSFGAAELYEKHPYKSALISTGFAFEDWTWNAEIHTSGLDHLVVPKTLHFIRLKPAGSRNISASHQWCLPGRMPGTALCSMKSERAESTVKNSSTAPRTKHSLIKKTLAKVLQLGNEPKYRLRPWMHEELFRQRLVPGELGYLRALNPQAMFIRDASHLDDPLHYANVLNASQMNLLSHRGELDRLIWLDSQRPRAVEKVKQLLAEAKESEKVFVVISFKNEMEPQDAPFWISIANLKTSFSQDRYLHFIATLLSQGIFGALSLFDSDNSRLFLERYSKAMKASGVKIDLL